jgi:hypothetical protein
MKKGIIPFPDSGLGNQIFIYIAGYVASEHLKCPLYLFNNTNCNNSHSNRDYKESIFKYLGNHINYPIHQINENPYFCGYSYHHLNIFSGFEPWDFSSINEGMILRSYYQYYPPLIKYESDIRKKLLLGLKPYIDKVKSILNYDFNTCAFLHVRRGDYVIFSDRHYLQPLSYYEYCMKQLLLLNPNVKKILLISDDIDWVKSQYLFTNNYICEVYENDDELESLSLMTLCKAGSICANSTFSWWGAFLGCYENRNPVFVPEKWMLTTSKINLFPDEWIIVKENL